KLRFKDQLEIRFDISRELLAGQEVPFHFLQPIVENCFKHGFKDRDKKMEIQIRAFRDEKFFNIQVADNGCGISKRTMKVLRAKIQMGNEAHGTSMVVRKLQSVYGKSFWYDVKSVPGKGTTVSIQISLTGGEEK
ncbi:MAG: sensor histidine kinase, partial [Blautia sp.]